jgi:rhamnulokinase
VAGHDTASAVVGIHATEPNPFFVSSGTWILAGQELDRPVLTAAARRALFTNEYGPERTTRFLKNIAGFWIVEECRRRWGTATTAELLTGAQGVEIPDVLFDATDPRFLAPANMEAEVLDAVGVAPTTSRSATVGIIVNSLASTTAYVISEASALTGTSVSRVHIIGGGNRSVQFVERLRKAVGTEIVVGAEESAALGNAIVQGLSLGRWADLTSARSALAP